MTPDTRHENTAPRAVLQRLRCKNDTNGNPRRIYALHLDFRLGEARGPYPGDGYFKRTLYAEEDYLGRTAALRLMEHVGIDPMTVADMGDGYGILTATEYRELTRSPDLVDVHGLTDPATGQPWGA
jgi:hypothetical protein